MTSHSNQLSVTEYAQKLGISVQGVRKMIKEKRLPRGYTATKIGNVWIITTPE